MHMLLLALTRAQYAARFGVAAGVALAAWLVLLGLLAVATRARTPDPGPAVLELPGDEPPAVVALLADGWEVSRAAVPATLIDLATRRDCEDPQTIAAALLPTFGFSSDQMSCLVALWMGESGWRVNAENASSGAYGIPQSLPASKMATVGADYRTNPVTQIKWGLGYIRSSYGSPCGAYDFKQGHGWY